MFRQYFAGHELLAFPLTALIIFVGSFTWVVIAALRRRPDATSHLARLPLDDQLTPGQSDPVSSESPHVG